VAIVLTCEKWRLDVVIVIVTVSVSYVRIMLNVNELDGVNEKQGKCMPP